jgi:hypothetical protein
MSTTPAAGPTPPGDPGRARLLGVLGKSKAEYLELALIRDHLCRQRLHRRRLASTVGAEQPDAPPQRDVQVETVDSGDRSESLDHPAERDRVAVL